MIGGRSKTRPCFLPVPASTVEQLYPQPDLTRHRRAAHVPRGVEQQNRRRQRLHQLA